MKVLSDINARGTTVLMATHAKDIVNSMKKRVVEIHEGRLIRTSRRVDMATEITSFKNIIKQGFQGMWRNKGMGLASSKLHICNLLILGVVLILI